MATKFRTNFMNPFEEMKWSSQNNPLFKEDDWNYLMNYNTQSDVERYASYIKKAQDKGLADKFANDNLLNDFSVDEKIMFLATELDYVDNSELKKHDIVVGYDSLGKPKPETVEMTDKQYYQRLFAERTAYAKEQRLLQEKEDAKARMNGWQLFWNSAAATTGELVFGALDVVESVINLGDALVNSTLASIDPFNWGNGENDWMQTFRSSMADDKLINLSSLGLSDLSVDLVMDDALQSLMEFERDNTYYRDVNGNYTGMGKILGGVANSIGRQIPSILLTAAGIPPVISSTLFYSSSLSSNLKEDFRRFADYPSISTEFIIAQNALNTGLEWGIELTMGKLFGDTLSDTLRGVSGVGKMSTGFKRWLGDTLQEGAEEVLQETGSWLVSNLAGIFHDEYRTDITWQQIHDAFVGGVVAAGITGGIQITRQTMYDNNISKLTVIGDTAYADLGDITSKKETAEQKKYRRGKYQAIKAAAEIKKQTDKMQVVDKKGATKFAKNAFKRFANDGKTSVFGNTTYGHGLKSIVSAYNDAIRDVDTSTDKGRKFIAQLNTQLYAGYKAMMDVYGEFGQERMIAAEKLLNDLDTYNDNTAFAEQSSVVAESLSKQLHNVSKNYEVYNLTKKLSAAENAEKEGKIPAKVTVSPEELERLDRIMKSEDTDLSEDELQVKHTATTLAKLYEQDLVLWDNRVITEKDGVIFAPFVAVQNMSSKELVKSAAERSVAIEYMNSIPKNVLLHFVEEFKKYSPNATDGETDTIELLTIYNLLYNRNFYTYLLNKSDLESFNVLKAMDNTISKLIEKNDNKSMRREYYDAARRIRKTMGVALAWYLCNNPKAKFENITVFSENQLQFIKEHRYNYILAARFEDGIATDDDVNVILNRINGSTLSEDVKNKFVSVVKSKSSTFAERKNVLKTLDKEYDNVFYGKYNDIQYLSSTTDDAARFNAFVENSNTSVYNIVNGIATDDIRNDIERTYGNSEPSTVRQYYQDQFRVFTGDEFGVSINIFDGKYSVEVYSLTNEQSAVETDRLRRSTDVSDLSYAVAESSLAIEYLRDEIDPAVDDVELTFTTVDDVVKNPEKYLSEKSIKEIRQLFKVVNKNSVFKYLQTKILDKTSGEIALIVNNDGEIMPVYFKTLLNILSPELAKLDKDGFDLYNKYKDSNDSYSLRDFIDPTLISGESSYTEVEFDNLSERDRAIFDERTNTITINVSKPFKNIDFFVSIVHEWNHLVQVLNNFGTGMSTDFVVSKDMILDIKKHVPGIFNNKRYTDEQIAADFIYLNVTGELLSRGTYLQQYGVYPIRLINNGNQVVMPWGKTYDIIYKNSSAAITKTPKVYDVDVKTLKEDEKVKSLETLEQRYNKSVDYQARINEALAMAKSAKDNGVKLYKKDLKDLKLPADVVDNIVKGTYKKSSDENYQQTIKVIASYKRKQRRDKHKKHFEEGKKSNRSRALFEKNVKGTNLEYWLKKYPDKIPEVAPEVQEFVIGASDLNKLPKSLSEKIKNATLTTRDIYNYIRDAENMNDYTFQELKKAFFKNTPFNSFNEVKSFVNIVEEAYAIKAGFLSIEQEHYVDRVLNWDLKDYKKNFERIEKNESVSKVISDARLRFDSFWITNESDKRVKETFDISDAEADIILGLLKYFDKSIDSLAYVAGNAKYALQRSVTNEQPFTYKQKKDVSGHSVISIDAQVANKKGDDEMAFADIIADERSRLEGNSDAENRAELLNYAKEYIRELINKGDIETATKLGSTIAKNIRAMSDDEVELRLAIVNSMDNTGMSFDEAFNVDYDQVAQAIFDPETEIEISSKRSNVYNSVKGIVNRLAKSHISGKVYKNLPDEYKKYFDEKNGYRFNSESVKGLNAQELETVKDDLKELGERIRSNEFASAKAKSTAEKLRIENERLRQENAKLKAKQNGENVEVKGKVKTIYTTNVAVDVTIESDTKAPDVLEKLLKTTFYNERESTKKFSRIENERYLQVSMREFFTQNAETLSQLTENDVISILQFFESANIVNRDYVPYDTLRVYILAYFVEQIQDGNFNVDTIVLDRCKAILDGIVSNTAARTLSAWRSVMNMVNPNKVIMKQLARSCDIELLDEEVEPLVKTLKKLSRAEKTASTDPQYFKNTIDELNQVVSNIKNVVLERYRGRKSKSYTSWFDKLLKFQKAAMLSAPATAVRNKLSNIIIGGFDIKGKHIWGMNDVADWIGNLFKPSKKSKTVNDQYNFRNVTVTTDTAKFIQKWILDTGLLDLISDGLSKYDSRTVNAKSGKVENQLQDMIVKSIASRIVGEHTYGKGKFTAWLEGKTGKTFEHSVLDNVVNFVFKLQSDQSSIQKTALKYLGKMLQANNIDLSTGVNENVMSCIADAYTMASWDYMHRSNFISNMENSLKSKYPSAHFAIKAVLPFASSSWNWFLETLQMNPVALLVNIRKLNNLEKVVANMDERKRLGDYSIPDSRFAEMIVRRNIGKGIVGTFLMLVGIGLGALGKITVDEEDDKLKLKSGDTWIDISNIFGTSSLLVGAAIARPSEGNVFTILENAFNQQFEDSMLTQLMNMFRYDNTPYDYITGLPSTIASGFVPNVWKAIVKLTNNHTVKYSPGMLGNIQSFAVQTIPFIEYAMPKGIDPYTGEWEEKYSIPALHQLASLIGSPISFKTYNMSQVEKQFASLGINKSMLKGKYDDIGQVDANLLNQFYGKLNNSRVTDFVNNKVKYDVKDENDKTVSLYYRQMSDEQKKSVLNRITSQNAKYAKIYTWTQAGHKYYCSSNKRLELIKLGIAKNVYIGNKGFVN